MDGQGRKSVVEALGALRETWAVIPVIRILEDIRPEVRWQTATALGILKDERAIPPLISKLTEDDWRMKQAVVEACGLLEVVEAVTLLLWLLEDQKVEIQVALLTL